MSHFEEDEDKFHTRKNKKLERKIASRTDRSKFKKTDYDKRQLLLKEKELAKMEKKDLISGRVLSILPEGIYVQLESAPVLCHLSGALKKEISRIKNLLTVGDIVFVDPSKKTIAGVQERYSILSRQEHSGRRQAQLIAANIDQVIITSSACSPPLKPALIDRYVIATLKGDLSPLIVINKIDLLDKFPIERALYEDFLTVYQKLGHPLLSVSSVTGEGMDQLKETMMGKASVFSGQSGVGKSSLINAVAGLELPVGGLTKKTGKGSHTTSSARLLPLPFGGWCIDTPGIRSFGVWDIKREDLDSFFTDIAHHALDCHYPNCTHTHEPSCGVRDAVEKNLLSTLRYDSYVKLLHEL